MLCVCRLLLWIGVRVLLSLFFFSVLFFFVCWLVHVIVGGCLLVVDGVWLWCVVRCLPFGGSLRVVVSGVVVSCFVARCVLLRVVCGLLVFVVCCVSCVVY